MDVEASGVSVHCLIFNGFWLCLIAAPLSSRHSLPHAKELIFLALGDGPRQKKYIVILENIINHTFPGSLSGKTGEFVLKVIQEQKLG